MWYRSAACLLCACLASVVGAADPLPGTPPPPKLPAISDDTLADPKQAAALADELDREYPAARRPEAIKMLTAILRGDTMSGAGGWFGPAQTRYTWKWLADLHGVDPAKGEITTDTFRGPEALFARLDRDGNGRIAADDFDWSDRSPYVMQTRMTTQVFRRMNAKGDGKLTKEELEAFFERAAKGKEFVTPDDLRAVLFPPSAGAGGFAPGDAPKMETLVRGLYAGEIGSIHEGPKVGAAAPDFALKTFDGKDTVRLSKLTGKKPVVLVFGNFTCGPFRALAAEVEPIFKRYKDDAHFVMVYVREAHPTDGWAMASNAKAGVELKQPTTYDERVKACGLFSGKVKPGFPVLVDEIDDRVGHGYSGMPGRLYVIDAAGKVAYKSGRGPFGFRAGEMEQALLMALVEQATEKK
jgi:thiol-disulfide isomerase/thioredoxin